MRAQIPTITKTMKIRLLYILCILMMSLGIQAQKAEFETAAEAVKNMKVGWMLWNSLESHSGLNSVYDPANYQSLETAWGQPKTKPELIKMLRKAGFNVIRVPVTWFPYMDEDGNVDSRWMKRVHEVVDYVIDQGMYCMLNVHHDTGDGDFCWIKADETNYKNNHKRFENLWRQIAEEFKDYDAHLLFEGYNEMIDIWNSWGRPYSFSEWSETKPGVWEPTGHDEAIERSIYNALNNYAQSFVNAVRSTGGNNKTRNLVINTYAAWPLPGEDYPLANLKIPDDETQGHIAFAVHYSIDLTVTDDYEKETDRYLSIFNERIKALHAPMIIGEWDMQEEKKEGLGYSAYFMKNTAPYDIATIVCGMIDSGYRTLPAFQYPEHVRAMLKGYYGEDYEPTLLTEDDYDIQTKVSFEGAFSELKMYDAEELHRNIDLNEYKGIKIELENNNDIVVKAYGETDGKEQYFLMSYPEETFNFDKSELGNNIRLITLQNWKEGKNGTKILHAYLIKKDGTEESIDINQYGVCWGCDFEIIAQRKQYIHTVAYDSQWSELCLFNDDIPLKLKNYKGIRLELAEKPKEGTYRIKVYGDGDQKEDYLSLTGTTTTVLFNTDIFSNEINRITLQSDIDGESNLKVISAWLIRQDGTEEYSDLSPFWGCEITEKTPYNAAPIEPVYNTFDRYLGGDLSLLPRFEQEGKTYLDDQGNKVDDVLRFLKEEKQFNSIRVRLFVDPSYAPEEHREWGAIQDMEMVKALGKRIKDLGMAFMLDFHYSDTWADPGNQYIPHAWEGLSDEELYTAIYEYTKNSLRELIEAGATPDMIQIGNEVDHGMLWGEYVDRGSSDYSWNRFIRLLKEASKACREVCPQAKVIIHNGCAGVDDLQYFSEKVKEVDYDIVGLSFYLTWDSFDNLKKAFDMFEREFREKDVMVVETNQAYKGDDDYYGYPCTEDGQNNYLNDMIKMLWEYPQVKGLYWWLPEGFRQGLWSEETGKPLAALSTMATFLTQPSAEKVDVTDKYLVNPTFDSDLHGWTNTGGTAKWREHTWDALSNFCEFEWTGGPIANQEVVQTITLPAGSYRLSVTCASDPGSSGLYLIAGSYSKEMPGTGGVDSFSLDFNVAEESAISIGMKVENTTATWVNFDNFRLEKLEATAIIAPHGVKTKGNNLIYNMWGQRLTKPRKGINIVNGKKVIVR